MKKSFFLIVLFSLLSLYSFAQQSDNSSEDSMNAKAAAFYNSAIQSIKAEQYENALLSLDSSLMVSKDYRIYYLQGQVNLKLGKTNEAITSFTECTKLKPDYDLGWLSCGNAKLASKDYDEAINDFNKVIETSSNEDSKNKAKESIDFALNTKSIEYYNKGNELNKQGNLEEAIKNYDMALAISKDSKYYYQKGVVLTKLKKYKEAEDELKTAISLDDNFDLGYIALGNIQTVNKDFDNAVKSYEKALAVTQNENLKSSIQESISKTYYSAGNSSYVEKKYDKSIEWFTKSISVSASDISYLGLAKAYVEKKKYSDAITALDSAKSLQKNVTEGAIAYYKGLVHLNKGEDSKAAEQFNISVADASYKKASQSQLDYLKKKNSNKK
jgi:tetratricopeptide (TPR) repeat protein